MLPGKWQNVRRILAVRLDNIGDIVMLSPALRTLRAAFPGAHVTLMASPAGTQVAPLLPWVDDVLTYRTVWQDASGAMPLDPERELALVDTIQEGHYDAAFIFTSFSQSPYPPAYVCYLAGIPVRVGQSKEFGGSVLSQWVKPLPDNAYQAERNLHLLEQAGLTAMERHLELAVPADVQARADDLLASVGVHAREPFIVLAPGASCAARRYDPARFAEVARLLAETTQLPLVIVGSESEKDVIGPVLAVPRPELVSLVGRTSIPELAAVIRCSALLVANDSGPMHMGDAFLRPMVILYSGTELESQWAPRNAPTRLLRRPTACSPCHAFRCPYNMECLDIPPDEVVSEVLAMLKRRKTAPGSHETRVDE